MKMKVVSEGFDLRVGQKSVKFVELLKFEELVKFGEFVDFDEFLEFEEFVEFCENWVEKLF